MAIKKHDKRENRGLRPFFNEHFGANEEGQSYASQMMMALPNAYTFNILKANHLTKKEKAGFATISLIPMTVCTFMSGMIAGLVHSDFIYDHNGSMENDLSIQSDQLEGLEDVSGYITLRNDDGEAYLLHKDEAGAFQIYEGDRERSGDYSFTAILDPEAAAFQSMQLANDFQARASYPDLAEQDPYTQIIFEGISAPFQEEAQGPVMRGGDEPEFYYLSWETQDLATLLTEAQDYFDGAEGLSVSGEMTIQENEYEAPMDRGFEGIVPFWALTLGLLGGWGIGGTAMTANASSKRRYKNEKTKGHKPL